MDTGPDDHEARRMHEAPPDAPIEYPRDTVIGVLDSEAQLRDAVKALTNGGFLDSEITIVSGPVAADRLAATTGRHGLAGLAIRIAERLGIEDSEMERKSQYEQAMRDGRYVVTVATPTDARKERATQILRESGAHSVNYFGRFTIEGLVPPRRT